MRGSWMYGVVLCGLLTATCNSQVDAPAAVVAENAPVAPVEGSAPVEGAAPVEAAVPAEKPAEARPAEARPAEAQPAEAQPAPAAGSSPADVTWGCANGAVVFHHTTHGAMGCQGCHPGTWAQSQGEHGMAEGHAACGKCHAGDVTSNCGRCHHP